MNLKKSGERKVQQIQLKDRFKDKKTLTRVLLQPISEILTFIMENINEFLQRDDHLILQCHKIE